MFKKLKIVGMIGLAIGFLIGCEGKPIQSSKTDNPNFQVELLFTHDDCKIYRFYDGGNAHYFVVYEKGCTRETTYRQQGKQKTPESIDTVNVKEVQ